MYKAGTVEELSHFEALIDRDVYREALRIVTMLDDEYGPDRDIDNDDGGFVLIVENVQDISDIGERYMKLDNRRHEAVDVVKCWNKPYINAFFLSNNEYGINVFVPIDIAPAVLLADLSQGK